MSSWLVYSSHCYRKLNGYSIPVSIQLSSAFLFKKCAKIIVLHAKSLAGKLGSISGLCPYVFPCWCFEHQTVRQGLTDCALRVKTLIEYAFGDPMLLALWHNKAILNWQVRVRVIEFTIWNEKTEENMDEHLWLNILLTRIAKYYICNMAGDDKTSTCTLEQQSDLT